MCLRSIVKPEVASWWRCRGPGPSSRGRGVAAVRPVPLVEDAGMEVRLAVEQQAWDAHGQSGPTPERPHPRVAAHDVGPGGDLEVVQERVLRGPAPGSRQGQRERLARLTRTRARPRSRRTDHDLDAAGRPVGVASPAEAGVTRCTDHPEGLVPRVPRRRSEVRDDLQPVIQCAGTASIHTVCQIPDWGVYQMPPRSSRCLPRDRCRCPRGRGRRRAARSRRRAARR